MSNKNNDTLIEITNLSKTFPGVKALDKVNFTLRKGEIHGLMGENGAGKSTLIKVLTGLYQRDGGEILYESKPFNASCPQEANAVGISTLYQEVNLIPDLSVAENIYIGREPKKFGRIDWKKINRDAENDIKKLELDIDVTAPVSTYSMAIQQLIAIIRALNLSAKVLILDEPTSSLDLAEVKQLFKVVRRLKDEGIGILFVSHFLDQVYEITDRITVLRNGCFIGEYETAKLPRLELIAHMLGKDLNEFYSEHDHCAAQAPSTAKSGKSLLRVEGLEKKGSMNAFSMEIGRGEIVGLAGLLGSGRTETARLLFGIDKHSGGKIFLNGEEISLTSPKKAIDSQFAFCPEDRKKEGLVTELSVRDNIILALQARTGIFKPLSVKQQEALADKYIKLLQIKTPSQNQTVNNLSGGNQQKVIIARWLATNPVFLILDEPTRGIDVGAKTEIEKLIHELRNDGMAILFISSELEEVVACSDRIAVLRDRNKLCELTGEDMEERKIMQVIAEKEIAL